MSTSFFGRGGTIVERIAAGRTDLVWDALEQGTPATAEAGGGPLMAWCTYYGDVAAVRHLLANGAPRSSLGANLGLDAAAFHGHWQLCEFLLEQGADPNHSDPQTGETPLHAALCKPNRPAYDLVAQVLLAAGADPNRTTIPGVETGAFMRDCRTRGETALHRAAAFGSEATIRGLLDAGAIKSARDANGDSPLSWASWHTRPDAVLRLLCYDGFTVREDRGSTFDHGTGWGAMELSILGRPLSERR